MRAAANILLGLLLALGSVCRADSLLDLSKGDLFAPRTITVGDLVTIRIADQSRTSRQVAVKSGTNAGITGPLMTLVSAVTGFDFANEDESQRNETANSTTQYTDTVTARVIATEGDRLVLQASRRVSLEGEPKVLALEGVCRRQDVGPDNSIVSDLLADAVIKVDGIYNSPVSPGILTRAFRILF